MQFRLRPIVAALATVVMPLAAGCGGDADSTAAGPAAINGSDAGNGESANGSDASARPQPVADPLHPVVVIDTSLGSITVRLDKENVELTVNNFLSYVDSGHYDGTVFHQVIRDYPKLILGGAFTPDGVEKSAHTAIYNEAHKGLKNRRGTIAMARRPDAVDSATCYFFLNLTDNEMLDHKDRTLEGYGYCVFGEVTEGLDVAERIAAVDVHDTGQFERIPVETVVIRSVRRLR